jgi:hypothetical protein
MSDSPRRGQPPEIRIDEILARRLERDRHAIAQKLAYLLDVSLPTVATDLQEGLGMKYFHLRWVPHLLTSSQNAMRFKVVKMMGQQMAVRANAGIQHEWTGDESWMASNYTPSRMWRMAWSDVDPIA